MLKIHLSPIIKFIPLPTRFKVISFIILLIVSTINPLALLACTIFSAKDSKGNVWFGNNEDGVFSFKNYINVFPKTKDIKFGYYTLSKDEPENGENAQIAGGMNEAGLIYDFNSTELYPVKEMYLKKEFPKGDKAILSYILSNFETVEEVVSFFQTYWFQFGFRSAQMHVADKYGHFALISPTGSRILANAPFQISTNFDICGKADSTSCWRYPIVQRILKQQEPSLSIFTDICKKTAQGRHTIYSSISNLTTGDITFYFSGDYKHSYQTTINDLLKNGRKSYNISELIPQNPICQVYNQYQLKGSKAAYDFFTQMHLSTDDKNIVLPNLLEFFTTEINDYAIYPFLSDYITNNDAELNFWFIKIAIEIRKGHIKQAKETVKASIRKFPDRADFINSFFSRTNGTFEKDINTTFVLDGYPNAKFVIIKSISASNDFGLLNNLTFMSKEHGKWIYKLKLSNGIYNYKFIVDGKEVLAKNLPTKTVENLLQKRVLCHQLCLGFTDKTYPLRINLKVLNKEDEVYIVGNQEAIFAAPLIFIKRESDYERTINLNVHYPAVFKFLTGAGKKEAILKGLKEKQPIEINSGSDTRRYEVIRWE